jgi:hypothetical protein
MSMRQLIDLLKQFVDFRGAGLAAAFQFRSLFV